MTFKLDLLVRVTGQVEPMAPPIITIKLMATSLSKPTNNLAFILFNMDIALSFS